MRLPTVAVVCAMILPRVMVFAADEAVAKAAGAGANVNPQCPMTTVVTPW